jgi:hypothetical protein
VPTLVAMSQVSSWVRKVLIVIPSPAMW